MLHHPPANRLQPFPPCPNPHKAPAAWLRWAYALLDREECSGCTACSHKCAGAIPMWREEAITIHSFVEQKHIALPGSTLLHEWTLCIFLNPRDNLCRIYPVRPLVCRAFGLVPWLPCPIDRVGLLADSLVNRIVDDYTSRPRRPFFDWLRVGNSVS
jgi:ferredoxin